MSRRVKRPPEAAADKPAKLLKFSFRTEPGKWVALQTALYRNATQLDQLSHAQLQDLCVALSKAPDNEPKTKSAFKSSAGCALASHAD